MLHLIQEIELAEKRRTGGAHSFADGGWSDGVGNIQGPAHRQNQALDEEFPHASAVEHLASVSVQEHHIAPPVGIR